MRSKTNQRGLKSLNVLPSLSKVPLHNKKLVVIFSFSSERTKRGERGSLEGLRGSIEGEGMLWICDGSEKSCSERFLHSGLGPANGSMKRQLDDEDTDCISELIH